MTCTLCHSTLPHYPVTEAQVPFCCVGCHAVYKILERQGQLHSFQSHPLFQNALSVGLISNPLLLDILRNKPEAAEDLEWRTLHLIIDDLWCPSCSDVIKWTLLQKKGVRSCVVDYTTDLASIEYTPRHHPPEELLAILSALGYHPRLLTDPADESARKRSLLRLGVSSFFTFNIMMLGYPLYASFYYSYHYADAMYMSYLSAIAFVPVITWCARPIYQRWWNGIKVGYIGMESLIVLALFTGSLLSLVSLAQSKPYIYFDSLSVIVTLTLLGKILESKAKQSAKSSLLQLTQSLPKRVRTLEDGFKLLKEVQLGDKVVTYGGERFCIDGEVLEGEGTCDESVITGEASPIEKRVGDRLVAGTILLSGKIIARVTGRLEDSMLYKVIDLVTSQAHDKSHKQRLIDQVSQKVLFFVMSLALFTLLLGGATAVDRALAILLIACPCAIGIAIPLAESSFIQRLAEMGILVRNRTVLDKISSLNMFLFDKTGTLTSGSYRVVGGLDRLPDHERQVLFSMSSHSMHPAAKAVAQENRGELLPLDMVQELPGLGIQAAKGENLYYFGSKRLAGMIGLELPDGHELFTENFFIKNRNLEGVVRFGDCIKKEVGVMIAALPGEKWILSGDQERIVAYYAQQTGISRWRSEQNPLEKREFILQQRTKNMKTCFVGDGINDAPALTAADVGISVSSASDIAIQVSDLLLTTKNLSVLASLISIGKLFQKTVRYNLFWAFFYNGIGILLAALGLMQPVFAAVAMTLSSLFVYFSTSLLSNKKI